jgi:peroxiredoxin
MTNENLKNSLLIKATIEFISNNKEVDNYDAILNSFLAKSTNTRHKDYVSKIVGSLKNLKPGNTLPDVKVFDIFNNELNLRFVLGNKPSVIFFWSQSNMTHAQECHVKAKELKLKYPEVTFIGVNANNENKDLWIKTLEKYNFETPKEYLFKNPKEANQALAIYPINKVIIVGKKGLIENSHANMFSINFEEELLGVLNQ